MMLRSTFLTLLALAELPQVIEGEQPRVVAVAPGDAVGVIADRLDRLGRERHQLARLQDAEGVGRGGPLLAAAGARAVVAQVPPGDDAAVPVAPLDDEAI